jgi:hypothetical protein
MASAVFSLSVRGLAPALCALFAAAHAAPVEILSSFRPSGSRTEFGKTSEVEFSTGFVELEPGVLAHHIPHAMRDYRFDEQVWVIGYRTEILDSQGKTPRENYLCHTFLADQRVAQRQDDELRGIYSDAFTPEVRLPDGFGIPFSPDDRLHWMPMFNNRRDEPIRVVMKVVVTVIRQKDLSKPLRTLYASLRSVQVPHLFFIPPGNDKRQVTFVLPFNGRIHFMGTHIHPYGASIEFENVTRGEPVWKAIRDRHPDGPMQVFSSTAGYPVHAGETYRIISVYRNPTSEKIDGMAGLFILYSRD